MIPPVKPIAPFNFCRRRECPERKKPRHTDKSFQAFLAQAIEDQKAQKTQGKSP
jgi:hypothetical protein